MRELSSSIAFPEGMSYYFELICNYKNNESEYLFKYNNKNLKEFNKVMKIIELSNNKCNPKKVFKKYEFKRNIELNELEEILNNYSYEIGRAHV